MGEKLRGMTYIAAPHPRDEHAGNQHSDAQR